MRAEQVPGGQESLAKPAAAQPAHSPARFRSVGESATNQRVTNSANTVANAKTLLGLEWAAVERPAGPAGLARPWQSYKLAETEAGGVAAAVSAYGELQELSAEAIVGMVRALPTLSDPPPARHTHPPKHTPTPPADVPSPDCMQYLADAKGLADAEADSGERGGSPAAVLAVPAGFSFGQRAAMRDAAQVGRNRFS